MVEGNLRNASSASLLPSRRKVQHPPEGSLIAIHHRQGEGFVVVIRSFGGKDSTKLLAYIPWPSGN